MRSLSCVKLQLADENGVVHLRQDRPSIGIDKTSEAKYIQASAAK